MSILSVENVSHDFGGRTILENASFRLLNGEHIGLVGANGEGKSTFLNIITGKIAPDSGKIEWCKRISTGYLDQHTALHPGKTIYETLQDAFKYYYDLEAEMLSMYEQMADCDDETMNQLMEEVGEIQEILDHGGFYTIDVKIKEVAGGLGLNDIGLDKPVDALSGGQRSKVLLTKLLLENPMILILDEPTAGLDTQATNDLLKLIKELNKKGTTIIMVTHQMEQVAYYANHVIAMSNGQVVADTTPQQLFSDAQRLKKLSLTLPVSVEVAQFLSKNGITLKNTEPLTLDALADEIAEAMRRKENE